MTRTTELLKEKEKLNKKLHKSFLLNRKEEYTKLLIKIVEKEGYLKGRLDALKEEKEWLKCWDEHCDNCDICSTCESERKDKLASIQEEIKLIEDKQ